MRRAKGYPLVIVMPGASFMQWGFVGRKLYCRCPGCGSVKLLEPQVMDDTAYGAGVAADFPHESEECPTLRKIRAAEQDGAMAEPPRGGQPS